MRTLELKEKPFLLNSYQKVEPHLSHFDEFIDQDTLVTVNEDPVLLYKRTDDFDELGYLLSNLEYQSTRSAGIETKSLSFGYLPGEEPHNKLGCGRTKLFREDEPVKLLLEDAANDLSKAYEKEFPKRYADHTANADHFFQDRWRIGASPYTNGIINQTNALPYHHDEGNFKTALTSNICFRENALGGYLSLPQLGVGVECAHNSIVLFDGQKYFHGVTPITLKNNGYRITCLFYSLVNIWKCKT